MCKDTAEGDLKRTPWDLKSQCCLEAFLTISSSSESTQSIPSPIAEEIRVCGRDKVGNHPVPEILQGTAASNRPRISPSMNAR